MPDDLWRKDAYSWSLQQAERLRRLRAGERVNDLDWDNIIEEIESVGQSQVDACRSLLAQAILHLLKTRSWPGHPASRKWRVDAADFLVQAQDKYRPSMARAIDLPDVLAYALRRLPWQRFTAAPAALPPLGEIPLDALANREFTIEQLEAALFPPA
jgi:hypothetical protein